MLSIGADIGPGFSSEVDIGTGPDADRGYRYSEDTGANKVLGKAGYRHRHDHKHRRQKQTQKRAQTKSQAKAKAHHLVKLQDNILAQTR